MITATMKVIAFLEGKKTYFVAALVAVVAVAEFMGWIDMQTATSILGILGAGGLASLRSAVKKA